MSGDDVELTQYEVAVARTVREIVPDIGGEEPAADAPLFAYGIGSLALVEILGAIEDEFDVSFDVADDLGEPVTVRTLAVQLARKSPMVE